MAETPMRCPAIRSTVLALSLFCPASSLAAQAPEALPGDPRQVGVDGARFHYVDRGVGEPMVLVHGTLQDYTAWLPHVDVLDDNYRVIAYSRRHNWPNDNGDPPPDYSARYAARDLAGLIEALELEPVHLVGFSYGALTSLLVAIERPELIRTLVLAEPPLEPEALDLPAGAWIRNVPRYAGLVRQGKVRQGMELFAGDVLGEERVQQIPETDWDQLMLNAGEFRALVSSSRPYPPIRVKKLKRIRRPTLVLLGEDNIGTAFESSNDALVRYIPGAEAVTIPGAGHIMWIEQGVVTRQAVLGFLERWGGRVR
jgi:pimeloyl-ACP methyl ester carboxylesterase